MASRVTKIVGLTGRVPAGNAREFYSLCGEDIRNANW